MALTLKHRKILFISGMSVLLILLGMAVGSWAVDKIAGDPAVMNDIDKHFQNIDEKVQKTDKPATSPRTPDTRRTKGTDNSSLPQKTADDSKKTKRLSNYKKKPTPAAVSPPSQNPWPGLTEVAPATYSIDRGLMEAAKANPQPFIQGVRAVLAEKDGVPQGFRILGVRLNSALYALGLRHGDILTSVNGHKLSSIDEALLAAAAMKTATRFRVDVLREGQPKSFYYRVGSNN